MAVNMNKILASYPHRLDTPTGKEWLAKNIFDGKVMKPVISIIKDALPAETRKDYKINVTNFNKLGDTLLNLQGRMATKPDAALRIIDDVAISLQFVFGNVDGGDAYIGDKIKPQATEIARQLYGKIGVLKDAAAMAKEVNTIKAIQHTLGNIQEIVYKLNADLPSQ
ncbi:MAG: hypothetical protein NTV88_06015 [Candidatus Micrarchaeota archaeon]|nr:hypothetical protein [Candidatus Micrarchaeota archaeon]